MDAGFWTLAVVFALVFVVTMYMLALGLCHVAARADSEREKEVNRNEQAR